MLPVPDSGDTVRHLTTVVAAFAMAGSLLLAAPSVAAAPSIELRPGALPRGADLALAHLDGRHAIVDGDRTIHVDARLVQLLGPSGQAFLAVSAAVDGSRPRLLRIAPDGSTRTLLRGPKAYELHLTGDGNQIVSMSTSRHGVTTRVTVYGARSGRLEAERTFAGSLSVLDSAGSRVVFGGWGPNRTFRWDPVTDATRRISDRTGYAASLAEDRLSTFTRDPYLGGCTVVSRLTDASEVLWRSCDERVDSFSVGGGRMATVAILSDGIGPSQVTARRIHGKAIASYTARWFGGLVWEDATHLALFTNGRKQAAWIRCAAADCERAGDLQPVQEP
jgi:hypothetical protein